MKKTTLTLGEIYTLEAELNGSTNQQTGEVILKGLLSHKLSLLQKYWLTDLSTQLQEVKKTVDTLRNDMIVKYGEKNDQGNYSIPITIDKKDENGIVMVDDNNNPLKELNPKFQEFNSEMNTLLEETREMNHYAFTIESFEKIETEESYNVLFKKILTDSNASTDN